MKFEREHYIKKLISSKHNHLIKIVTEFDALANRTCYSTFINNIF